MRLNPASVPAGCIAGAWMERLPIADDTCRIRRHHDYALILDDAALDEACAIRRQSNSPRSPRVDLEDRLAPASRRGSLSPGTRNQCDSRRRRVKSKCRNRIAPDCCGPRVDWHLLLNSCWHAVPPPRLILQRRAAVCAEQTPPAPRAEVSVVGRSLLQLLWQSAASTSPPRKWEHVAFAVEH